MNLVEKSVQIRKRCGAGRRPDGTRAAAWSRAVRARQRQQQAQPARNRYVAGEGRYVLIHTGGNRWLLHGMDPAAPGRPAPRPGCCPPGSPVRTW